MTLALYGKSRKRQSGLIFAAFMAIIVASVGGLSVITSAFAHTISASASAQCDDSWSSRLWYSQGGSGTSDLRLVLVSNVNVNGTAYDPAWASGINNLHTTATGSTRTTGNAFIARGSYLGSTAGLPAAGTDFVWVGIDETFDIFNRNQGNHTPSALNPSSNSSVWGGSAVVYQWTGSQWQYAGYQDNVERPVAPTNCGATIHIKKNVRNAFDNTTFTADVNNTQSSEGDATDLTFSENSPRTHSFTPRAAGTDDYTVTEDARAGYAITGKYVTTGDASCPSSDSGSWVTTSPATASGGALNDIGAGDEVTVCFRNERRATIIIKKVVSGPGSSASDSFTAAVNNDDSSSGEASGLTFSQTTPYVHTWNEDNSTDDFDVTETNANQNGYEVVGTYVSTGDATCPAVPASGTTGWITTTPENAGGLDNIENGDTYTVCFWNRKVAAPSVSVTKDAPLSTYNVGQSFDWTITATVANGPTTSSYAIWDDIPAQFIVNSVTETDASLTCNNADPVSCTLASGAATGAHVITVNVTVANGATCGPVTNNVHNGASGTAPIVASDEVTIAGCGSVTIEKSDSEEVVGSDVIWTIVLKNSSAVSKSAIVYDPNTTLVAAGTVGCANNAQDDYYDCTVPANNGTATLKLSQAIPAHSVCDDYQLTNTAYIAASNTSGSTGNLGSDSGVYSDPANADKSCLTVTKDKTATSNPPTWTISVQNTADVGQSLWVVDAGATFQGASGGSCTAVAGDSMTAGIACTVNANSTLVITVTKPMPTATCQGTDVDNAVSIWVGTFTGTPTGTPADFTDNTGNQFTDLGADQALCSSVIEICKVWAFNAPGELSDGSTSFVFDVSDTSETEGVTISGVTEGNQTATCILVEVQNGLVTIDEQVPGGFNTPTYTSDIPGVDNGTGAGVEFFVDGESCYAEFPTLLQDVSGLVREVLAVVAPATGEPLCIITFTNTDNQDRLPTGDLRVEKYLDIDGDGDANGPGEGLIPGWDVNISGPDENGVFDLADGTNVWLGLTTNDVYILTEVQQAGFTVTNVTVDGVSKGASLFASAVIPNGGTTVVRFYNQPAGGIIIAHKVAVTSHNFGPDQDAPNDDDGWIITVTSAQCGINISLPTDANGNATFTNLPLCTDYVVSENPVNAASPGFNPVSPTSIGGQTPEGQTITFLNRKVTNDPPCVNCGPTPTPTVPTPTPTTPATPTSTPVPPTATPTEPSPVSTVVGERTPGPAASATPIAPSTGGGLMGGTSGGMNLVLIIAGLLALTSGLSFVALGRKHRS